MPPLKPLVYLVLGPSGSGRREVLADLLEAAAEGSEPAVLLYEGELPAAADARLGRLARWRWTPQLAIAADPPSGAALLFLVCDGRGNPVDQVEASRDWIASRGAALARILCVVDCRLASAEPVLGAWFEACVHFSDVVLLSRREGVPNKWIREFRARFEKKFYPCLFEFVKDGRVDNPARVLAHEARRMSQAFDEEPAPAGPDGGDEAPDEEGDEPPAEDPYFARRQGGRRVIELPDIAKFLPG